VDYGIAKPSNKLLGVTELDSGTRVGEPATGKQGEAEELGRRVLLQPMFR